MYSDKILALFKSQRIGIGDMIRIESRGVIIEGEVMPKTEANDPDTIVIKMKSGYNAGITYYGAKITKISGSTGPTKFPKAKLKEHSSLPKVAIVTTGGTIGSKIDYKTGGVHPLTNSEELFYYVPELQEIANVSIAPVLDMMSEDMTFVEWKKIADAVANALNNGARGVVVMHGTDTMHYTAAALSFMLHNLNAPVVITGSQRSSDRGSSDAFLNLICATNFAANSDAAEVGICMHASSSDDKCAFIRGTKTRKMHTSRRDAFRPINDKVIAYVTQNDIKYSGNYRKIDDKVKKKVEAHTKFEPRIALIKVFPNSDPDLIDFYIKKGYRGLILEGTGLGHLPVFQEHIGKSWLPMLREAVGKGLVVGVASQTVYGRVNPTIYRNLRLVSDTGVVYCEDMTSETAFVKLGWLLGNHTPEVAKAMLNKNIVGEIKQRLTSDEFLV